MKEYEFTLRFDTSGCPEENEAVVDRLAEAGCTDATIGVGVPGRFALLFVREAPSAREAVLSAVRDVRGALPQAVLTEAAPDLVGMSEIAEIVGKSRQNIRKLLLASRSAAPPPVHEGSSSLWHLAVVLEWLRGEKGYRVDEGLLELATMNRQLNATVEGNSLGKGISRTLRLLVRPVKGCRPAG